MLTAKYYIGWDDREIVVKIIANVDNPTIILSLQVTQHFHLDLLQLCKMYIVDKTVSSNMRCKMYHVKVSNKHIQ